jgi:hypothetical protein
MTIALVIMGLTVFALIIGLVFMAVGGKIDRKYSNKLMVLRVVSQGLAVIAIMVVYYLKKN